ncbi:MAG: PaaI family thioesterase [Firmicutes bacterium]|nr:PaaI family thioesterase [Bacillota bacterium]MDY5856296.1 PaaI family thioesterase [Anaerovoracaceae bacterium]
MTGTTGMADAEKHSGQDLLERTREIFRNDLFATEAAGIVIEDARPGYARCVMEIKKHHLNVRGAVMGGAIFTLADLAGAVAVNCGKEQPDTVALHADITFLSPAKGTRLIAEASCVKAGRTTSLFEIRIEDELGTKVAQASINGYTVGK